MKKLLRYTTFSIFMLLATWSYGQDAKPAFRVAPNPADDYIEVFFESEVAPSTIRIFDLIGNQVGSINVPGNTTHPIRIETANLKPGVYFMSVYSATGKMETLKFLKVR